MKVIYDSEGNPFMLTSTGSFHYLMNKGIHNANNVTFKQAEQFLLDFAYHFNIKLGSLVLKPFEYAQMINITFDVEENVNHTFCEQRKVFENNSPGNPSKISGSPSNDYRLKFYGKHFEHPLHCEPNTLRCEYQAKKMRVFQDAKRWKDKGLGIYTMADLLKKENWQVLYEMHIEKFSQLVIYDTHIQLPKNSKFKKDIINFQNPIYWKNLIKKCQNGETYEKEYNEKVSTLRKLSKKYGKDVLGKIMELLHKQWFIFLGDCKESTFEIPKIPTHAPVFKQTHAPFIVCMPCTYYQNSITRICPVTGIDISMQKESSKLLSNTGLKYLEKTNPQQFQGLRSILLTGQPNQFEKSQYDMISKQIRNYFYNNPDYYSGPNLFNF